MIALVSTRADAQATAAWQATTASMWSSDGGCASQPATTGRTLGSSETVSGELGLVDHRRASFGVSAAVAIGDRACDGERWSGSAAARLALGSPAIRFWMAYTASNAGSPDTAVRQAGLSAGIQRRLGRAVLSMSVGQRRDRNATHRAVEVAERLIPEKLFVLPGTTAIQETTYVADTVTRPATRRIPDLGLAVSYTYHALGIEAAAHLGLSSEPRHADPLARAQLTYALGPRVSVIAGVVSRSAVPALDIRARQFATLGVRLGGGRARNAGPNGSSRVSASEFRAVTDSSGQVSLAVRALGAQRVEVAGDFTHWAAISLQPASDGWWRARVTVAPGPHQLSVRVDAGRWRAPPGLSAVHDEFGTTVGLLVVQ
jgi:hypothetical protein